MSSLIDTSWIQKYVLVTGAFDVMHVGHIRMLNYASSFGRVFVATDTDEKIKAEKGANRPFNCLSDRIEFLEELHSVYEVMTFGSKEELEEICRLLRPDFRIVGSDWEGKEIVGGAFCKEIKYFPRIQGYSTTRILEDYQPKRVLDDNG